MTLNNREMMLLERLKELELEEVERSRSQLARRIQIANNNNLLLTLLSMEASTQLLNLLYHLLNLTKAKTATNR